MTSLRQRWNFVILTEFLPLFFYRPHRKPTLYPHEGHSVFRCYPLQIKIRDRDRVVVVVTIKEKAICARNTKTTTPRSNNKCVIMRNWSDSAYLKSIWKTNACNRSWKCRLHTMNTENILNSKTRDNTMEILFVSFIWHSNVRRSSYTVILYMNYINLYIRDLSQVFQLKRGVDAQWRRRKGD